jgi:hypothetical protein
MFCLYICTMQFKDLKEQYQGQFCILLESDIEGAYDRPTMVSCYSWSLPPMPDDLVF